MKFTAVGSVWSKTLFTAVESVWSKTLYVCCRRENAEKNDLFTAVGMFRRGYGMIHGSRVERCACALRLVL
jgi:hypothetical protein